MGILLLAEKGIRRCPPKDRPVWLVANIIIREGAHSEVEGYEGYARWNEASQDWQDLRGMSIRGDFEAELYPLDWLELAERAENAPDEETSIDANVFCYDDAWWREIGIAGFYAEVALRHRPTGEHLIERKAGPFPLRSLAISALAMMVSNLTTPTALDAQAA